MLLKLRVLFCSAALVFSAASHLHAQKTDAAPTAEQAAQGEAAEDPEAEAFKKFMDSIDWKTSGSGNLGTIADIQVPDGYRFTASEGTIKLMEASGNLTNGRELGYIAPLDMGWFAVFEFSDIGYVKDDEKDKLDANAILEQMKEDQKAANEELTRRGMSTLEVLGWHTPPNYNEATKNLEWAIRLRSSDGGEVLNFKTKVLGRRGVMDVVVVCDEQQMPTVIPEFRKLLTGFAFKKEESYAAFVEGDKVAEYGLAGLIVGGGLLAAAKSGLLAKLWKPILIGLVAIGAFFKRIFVGKTRESI